MSTRPISAYFRALSIAGAAVLGGLLLSDMTPADERSAANGFIAETMSNSQQQIARARQALLHGHTLAVRDQAQGVLDEHGKMLAELKALAEKHGLQVSSEPAQKQQSDQAQADLASSQRFDRDYAEAQLKASRAAVESFDRMSKRTDDPELQGFARLWLPMLYHQREIADQLVASQKP
ncbi:DUF4142 domain-containing protein [Pseudomonas sp. ZM23]|uniref:DUF4142 domain-containing protein n=1 Tax=Pseudomonas triclosanedens TaxID=2961893 RepID=A0ABY7A623_9PSED|nr:DUF4142 domain-containing protein [Pseudomonas triclosanedens]MCP8466242.1 DUF4142 domain-containing protein [Pseudomonas triclosanedens]MCP8471768.1 DUF4142 domain-containing protein [Pseudomonas triclosanedens]MCP8478879.1 DUF4142 domain-containing protein [Pseudomonas triclosanedens]WAI52340.1 DUF4142 domain-containing protein [Pseudomonas triclosanedens]